MINKTPILCLSTAVFLSACASNPDRIDAAYVSPLKYSAYDCQQVGQEMDYVGQRTTRLYQSLKEKRKNDNWQMGVGLVLFWPTLFALEGGDGPEAAEYSQLKGEFEALRQASVEKRCNLNYQSPEQLMAAASQADAEAEGQAPSSTQERLRELEALYNDGLITEDEYQAARKSALGI